MQSVFVPGAVALVSFLVLRFITGGTGEDASPVATIAIPLGFLAGYLLVVGTPVFPPRTSVQKIAYIAFAGLAIGLLFDIFRAKTQSSLVPAVCIILPAAAAIWLGLPKLLNFDLFALFTVFILWVGGTLGFLRLAAVRTEYPLSLAPAILLLVASLAIAGLSYHFASLTLTRLALALSAALAIIVIWNWIILFFAPEWVAPFGRGAILGTACALFGIAATLGLYTDTSLWALLFIVPVFFGHLVFGEHPSGDGTFARTFRPMLLLVVSAVPLFLLGSILATLTVLTAT